MRSGHHVGISMTFNQGFKFSRENVVDTSCGSTQSTFRNPARSKSMLKDFWFWDLVVLDEIHYLRNRKSKQSLAIQRLVVKGMIAIGATATPLWNTPINLIGKADAMRHPKVIGDTSKSDNPEPVATGIKKAWNGLSRERAKQEKKAKGERKAAAEGVQTVAQELEAIEKFRNDMDRLRRYARCVR